MWESDVVGRASACVVDVGVLSPSVWSTRLICWSAMLCYAAEGGKGVCKAYAGAIVEAWRMGAGRRGASKLGGAKKKTVHAQEVTTEDVY